MRRLYIYFILSRRPLYRIKLHTTSFLFALLTYGRLVRCQQRRQLCLCVTFVRTRVRAHSAFAGPSGITHSVPSQSNTETKFFVNYAQTSHRVDAGIFMICTKSRYIIAFERFLLLLLLYCYCDL